MLERGDLSRHPHYTGKTALVIDSTARAANGWLRVQVDGQPLRWHRSRMRRAPSALPIDLLKGDLLGTVLDAMGCHRSLARASQVCREWHLAARQP